MKTGQRPKELHCEVQQNSDFMIFIAKSFLWSFSTRISLVSCCLSNPYGYAPRFFPIHRDLWCKKVADGGRGTLGGRQVYHNVFILVNCSRSTMQGGGMYPAWVCPPPSSSTYNDHEYIQFQVPITHATMNIIIHVINFQPMNTQCILSAILYVATKYIYIYIYIFTDTSSSSLDLVARIRNS